MSAKPSDAKETAATGKDATKFALTLLGMAVLLLFGMVLLLPRLVPFDVLNQFYYLVLVGWGLAGAAILTGVLRGAAHVSGQHIGWNVQLGGGAAIAFLIVAGGHFFVPRNDPFDLTVRPRVPDSSSIVSGSIFAEFGNKTERADIHDGEADFKGIARTFWGKKVRMYAHISGYSSKPQFLAVTGNVIDFPLQGPSARVIRGRLNPASAAPPSARICILDETGTNVQQCTDPDATGNFHFDVKEEPNTPIRVAVCISGKLAFDKFEQFEADTKIISVKLSKMSCSF